MQILYVEDDPRDIDLTRRFLATHAPQIELDVVDSQPAAEARLAETAHDLVLTDLKLPRGDGLGLLAHIRDKGLPLPVVVITGRGDEDTVVAALRAGADDYVIKRNDYLTRLPQVLEDAWTRFRQQSARRGRPIRLLYAEHNQADVDLTGRYLKRYAPHILMDVASLGTIVAHRLTETEERYDILLLDYRLPGMHALDVLKELRQVHRLDLPVVLTTGHGDEEVALQALKLGAYDYVVKAEGYLLRLPAVLENAVYRVRLAREEARYRTLFENVPVGLYRTSLSGEILDANPALAAMLGYHDLAALRAVNANDLYLDPAQRGQQQALLEQEDTVRHYEMQMRRRDGRIIWVWDMVRAVRGSDGRLLWNEGSLEDITERKLAEDEIRQLNAELEERVAARTAELSDTAARLSRREAALQTANEKLKELDRLKSQFVSNVSHELRTPLTNITMYLHLLDHGKPERRAHYMTVLHNETVLLQRLIEDLLDLSQLDQGRARFDRTAVDVNRVLAMLVDARGLLASQRGLALEVQATSGLPHVLADATMLMQVLTNLLANALNYTPAGGRIELRSDLQEADGQTWVTLAVSDSGLGLTAADQAHIFERFYRGEAARQMGVAGTGLGLSICQEIIARHGGRISVQSAVGEGSTFTVWLAPCHRGSAVIESHQ